MATYRIRPYDITSDGQVRYAVQQRVCYLFWLYIRDNRASPTILKYNSMEGAEKLVDQLKKTKVVNA